MGDDREWLVEHRYRAVQEVSSGQPVTEVAARFGTSRQSVYVWKRRYEAEGLAGLREASRRPHTSPARVAAEIEVRICELRRAHPRWGARRISFELGRLGEQPCPSRATVHRVLVRNGPAAATGRRSCTDSAPGTRRRRGHGLPATPTHRPRPRRQDRHDRR